MRHCPIVSHLTAHPTVAQTTMVDELATSLLREHRELAPPAPGKVMIPELLGREPTLHIDDLTMIQRTRVNADTRFYQERARLRAGNGDLVLTTSPVSTDYEAYCRDQLGLGDVLWLHPHTSDISQHVAEASWADVQVRSELVQRLRTGRLTYLHPHMGSPAIWNLAQLLSDAAKVPIKVIAPHANLARWVNDKIAFAEVVTRLFGCGAVPRCRSAGNLAKLSECVRELSRTSAAIGIKLPSAAGGEGTIVLPADEITDLTLQEIRDRLSKLVNVIQWHGDCKVLVNSWEEDVLMSPSVQLWIPPRREGGPVLEGLFSQLIERKEGIFVGSAPVELPDKATQQITIQAWMIGRLFQRLGYVGRCSFDMVLVGKELEDSRIEFIECNGRWGGTSGPMTLMNRLFGDWKSQPYVTRVCESYLLASIGVPRLLSQLDRALWDARTGLGCLIITSPGRMVTASALDVISIGNDTAEALRNLDSSFWNVIGCDQ
ncbi:MAG: hypothetical protein R3E01_12035 [Pirellulaceae bacterium]|nr:hypothetical protein [Planctomycetales bacterium]